MFIEILNYIRTDIVRRTIELCTAISFKLEMGLIVHSSELVHSFNIR